eukprot:scaffold5294_cov129-Cylindrotheca_fusiformis.AAC.3
MERPNMEERNTESNRSELVVDEVASKFFLYTSQTKPTDIPKATLTHLRVDSSVREIPIEAFANCYALVHVQLPVTLTRIGDVAFGSCRELKCVQFVAEEGSLETSSTNEDSEEGTIMFPETLLQVGEAAFQFCDHLRKVIVCSASTQLCLGAFRGCCGLRSAELPDGLQVIEQEVFSACESLSLVNMPSSLIEIGAYALSGCSIETLHIPPTVATIGEGAFSWCSRLKHIKLPPTLERIEKCMLAGCEGLEYIEIPPTVAFIGQCAFVKCESLSHLRIPPSLDRMTHWALEKCGNLLSIELPEGLLIKEEFVDRGISCPSLVNLAIPPTEDFEFTSDVLYNFSKLGSIADNDADLLRKLKHRFDNCPLNKLCYYQSYYSSEEAMVQLRCLMDENPLAASTQVDDFGMSPLHILSLSQTPNVDMLVAVMKGGGPNDIIYGRDSFGSTPMDYLCLNRMPKSSEVIRTVLLTRFDELLGLDRSWKSDMWQAVDEALAVDWSSRRREVVGTYLKLANYEREEMLSFLLELCLWKLKIDEVSSTEQTVDRNSCRINSGASIVIPQVLSFLDRLDVEDYRSLQDDHPQVVQGRPFVAR